jgi:hypothetical protein
MRFVVPDPFDLMTLRKHIDIDRPRRLQSYGIDFIVLKNDVIAFTPLIALDLILLLHDAARDAVNITADPCITRLAVECMKANPLSPRRCRRHRDTACHER